MQADTVGGLLQEVELGAGITVTEQPLDQLSGPVEAILEGMLATGDVDYLLLRDDLGQVILVYTALVDTGG